MVTLEVNGKLKGQRNKPSAIDYLLPKSYKRRYVRYSYC